MPERLRQAEYFLKQAESNLFNRELFATYLEACISFGMSIGDVLQRETKKGAKRKSVWACLEPELKALRQEPSVEFLEKTRNIVMHQGQDLARAQHYLTVQTGVTVQFKSNVLVQKADGTPQVLEVEPELPMPPEKLPEGITEHSLRYFFNEGTLKDQDVLEKCREYLKRLKQVILVAEHCGA